MSKSRNRKEGFLWIFMQMRSWPFVEPAQVAELPRSMRRKKLSESRLHHALAQSGRARGVGARTSRFAAAEPAPGGADAHNGRSLASLRAEAEQILAEARAAASARITSDGEHSRSPSTRGGRMTASAETTAEASPHRVYVGGCFARWRSPRVTSTRSPAEARQVRGGEGAARPGRRAPARALPGKGRRPVTAAGLAAPLSEAARLALRDLAEALDCDRASG